MGEAYRAQSAARIHDHDSSVTMDASFHATNPQAADGTRRIPPWWNLHAQSDASGKFTNALEIRVAANRSGIPRQRNDRPHDAQDRTDGKENTDGICGIRVNHQLEVHINGFGVSKP